MVALHSLARFSCLMVGLLVMAACTRLDTVVVPNKTAQKADDRFPGQFIAGAATVDITPPPNSLPRAGYSMWSTTGQGFRTRLKARAYYLRDGQGHSFLVVQTDLTSGSRILHTRLGERLAKDSSIDAGNLSIMATHSHSAPGQIVGSQFYNKHISHVSGFAEDYFGFVLNKLESAARKAIAEAGPATLAYGQQDIWGLTRNRSLPAHVENTNVRNKSLASQRVFHAVNPTMHMVRIDRISASGETIPYAAFASFSIHGTALPEKEALYNADVWGYLHVDWQQVIEHESGQKTLHFSGFEATHGDVAPANRFGLLGYIEARRIGKGLAEEAIKLYRRLGESGTTDVTLQSSVRYVNLRQANSIEEISICRDPAAGMTLAAGPLEHTSPVIGYLPFFRQGSRRDAEDADDCQGRKRILGFSWGQPLLEPSDSFPDYVLFQFLRLNGLVIVPYPFELTVESGRRLVGDVVSAFRAGGESVDAVMIASLAGGYTGYITTPEEYGRQYYEGGHTIYGKNSLPFLRAHTRHLIADTIVQGKPVRALPDQWIYRFEKRRFLPEAQASSGTRQVMQPPVFYHALVNQEGRWAFRWRDVAPALMQFDRPLVSIETRKMPEEKWHRLVDHQRPVTDEGYDLSVAQVAEPDEQGMATYEANWYNPVFRGEQYEYRFRIEARAGQETFFSPAFH